MYAVKGIDVSTKVVDIIEHSVPVSTSLFNKHVEKVVEQIVEPSYWKLILLSKEGRVDYITSGNIIKIHSPMIRSKSCLGETLVSVTHDVQEKTLYIHRTSVFCNKVVNNGFCPIHSGSEYSRYLMFVYGLKELPQKVGLALVPHMVYLLFVGGSIIKVGIANAMKNINRLYEQVFTYATILTFVENVVHAREIEKSLSKSILRDRISLSDRIDWIKKIEPKDFNSHLKNYVTMFSRYVKPMLNNLKIYSSSERLPVVRFSNQCFEGIKDTIVLNSKDVVNNIEGVAEIEGYCLGGVTLNLKNKKVFLPYQAIRDRFIAIDIVR